jgi:hypothetical protein
MEDEIANQMRDFHQFFEPGFDNEDTNTVNASTSTSTQLDSSHMMNSQQPLSEETQKTTSNGTPLNYCQLKALHPDYYWGKPTAAVGCREPVGDLIAYWKGREILRGMAFPLQLWKPFIKYLNLLIWPPQEYCEEHRLRVSFAEWAIDFELWSGLRLEDPSHGRTTSWGRRATYMKLMWDAAVRFGTELTKSAGEFIQDRVTTLHVFGIPIKLQGLLRRPRFLMQHHTDRVIAINALEYIHTSMDPDLRQHTNSSGLRLAPTYQGISCTPLYLPPEQQQLKLMLYLRSTKRRRLNGKRKAPPPQEPNSTT